MAFAQLTMTREQIILEKAGPAPEGATHYDPQYPEFLKKVGNKWWFWQTRRDTTKGRWIEDLLIVRFPTDGYIIL